ncbi:MAG: hypothetical protein JKY54_16750 [Flavobacteriales bacterium]|nr:hypothetical protein [Flavobacteriales bacterium]
MGSEYGAKLYGLEIIAKGIETHQQNYTRFIIISNEDEPIAFNKASFILKLEHKKGALAHLLSLLDHEGINLSKIESFPVLGEPWHYEFFMDLEYINQNDHIKGEKIIQETVIQYRVLGKYMAH